MGHWHGAEQRSAGNGEDGGPRVSGHPGTSPWNCAASVGVRQRSQASLPSWSEGLGPNRKCTGDRAGHAGSHPVWALCPGPRHTLAGPGQDGSLEALPRGTVVRQGSHMEGGQPGQRLPGASPPPSRPPTPCHSSWKTAEEIKWTRRSATQCLLLPQTRHPTPVHPRGGSATEVC